MPPPPPPRTSRWAAWSLVAYAVLAPSLGAAAYARAFVRVDGQALSFGRALAWQAPGYVAWVPLGLLLAWAGAHLRPARLRERWWAGLPVQALLCGPLLLLHLTVVATATHRVLHPAGDWGATWASTLREHGPVDLLAYWGLVGLVTAWGLWQRVRARELEAVQLEAGLAQAQLRALRLQLQPHFLYNTLHAAAVLAPEQPEDAVRVLVRLGDLLRRTLEGAQRSEVPLAHELETLRLYLSIVEVRVGPRLRVAWEVEEGALGCAVPEFLLQPLVENAVQHGVERRPGPAQLTLRARREADALLLEVQDSGPGPGAANESGHGLAITRERLALQYGARASLELQAAPAGGALARVRLPWRQAP